MCRPHFFFVFHKYVGEEKIEGRRKEERAALALEWLKLYLHQRKLSASFSRESDREHVRQRKTFRHLVARSSPIQVRSPFFGKRGGELKDLTPGKKLSAEATVQHAHKRSTSDTAFRGGFFPQDLRWFSFFRAEEENFAEQHWARLVATALLLSRHGVPWTITGDVCIIAIVRRSAETAPRGRSVFDGVLVT